MTNSKVQKQEMTHSCNVEDRHTMICRNFMNGKCERENCRFVHDNRLCVRYWKTGNCKFGENCRKQHYVTNDMRNDKITNNKTKNDSSTKDNNTTKRRKPKNTECYEPWTKPFDMRIVYDNARDTIERELTARDVLIVPNLFREFETGSIYNKLVSEIENCSVPKEDLLKLWHGSEHLGIEGKHHICNDRTKWKQECPTFGMVIERITEFFGVNVGATRMNWYKTSAEYKPRHHDAAAFDPDKAEKQNITIGVSFGETRDIVFEHVKSGVGISIPQGDGDIYTFGNSVNVEWKHGVNPGESHKQSDTNTNKNNSNGGRISIIIWGQI